MSILCRAHSLNMVAPAMAVPFSVVPSFMTALKLEVGDGGDRGEGGCQTLRRVLMNGNVESESLTDKAFCVSYFVIYMSIRTQLRTQLLQLIAIGRAALLIPPL